MDDGLKTAIIAPRLMNRSSPPADWQQQISEIKGMSVMGNSFGRLQVRATGAALRSAREKFDDCLLIEEAAPRTLAE